MSRQPDFSTAPRPSRVPAFETVAVAVGLVALVLAGGAAWRARDEARVARARLDDVRREVEAASARLRALERERTEREARARRPRTRSRRASWRTSPPCSRATRASSACPSTTRAAAPSSWQVVARDASAWDRLLERLEQAPQFREVEPGPEVRDAEVRSLVRARWVGGPR